MNTNKYTIVFCDDDDSHLLKIMAYLKESGLDVEFIKQEQELLQRLTTKTIHVILIELDYKSKDAISLTSEVRNIKGINQPFIIIYSNKQDDFIQVTALNAGADDYISTPLKTLLIEARISALLKRYSYKTVSSDESDPHKFLIDKDRHLIITEKGDVHLPKKEFEMLYLLYSNPHKIFSRKDISSFVWNNIDVADKRTIDIHIRNIRKALDEDIIKTIKGVGYRFNESKF